MPLRWRHNERDSVSNHQPQDCLLNHLFRRRSKKTSKIRVTGLCVGNSPVTGEFPAQMASNADNVSIWWRHHAEIGSSSSRGTGRKIVSLLRHSINYVNCEILFVMSSSWHFKHPMEMVILILVISHFGIPGFCYNISTFLTQEICIVDLKYIANIWQWHNEYCLKTCFARITCFWTAAIGHVHQEIQIDLNAILIQHCVSSWSLSL